MKAKINIKNIYYYVQGNIRYKLYYSKLKCLIRKHILEQIQTRINSMDNQCYMEGQCKMCGCKTTHLQMCNKECDKPCYPAMLSKKDWNRFKDFGIYCSKEKKEIWFYDTIKNKFLRWK